MKWWKEYTGHTPEVLGKRKKFDNTIYTFDIETSSYLIYEGKVYPAVEYLKFNEKQRQDIEYRSSMYIWQFGVNETIYYGRTWEELRLFLEKLNANCNERKIVFIHNAAYEFQYLKTQFVFSDVMARTTHKVMKATLEAYNIEIRCSYLMSNASLAYLPELFNLPVQKKVGDLDYSLIRHSNTILTDKELGYCEYDNLVLYHYIISELESYPNVDKIPLTSTGHVRRELKDLVAHDWNYKRKMYNAINKDPHVYNLLVECFAGGYTHANWLYTDEIIRNVDSWDFTSSYPYILVTHKFPMHEFKRGCVEKLEDLSNRLAYILVVRFTNISTNYFNSFISASKCRKIKGAKYDNGRLISAEEIEIVLTDVDFKFILDSHNCSYEILESYYSMYQYLPKQFINFVLDKYVNKTQFKGIPEKEVAYSKEKNKFNALYGMCVTNTIRDNVNYDPTTDWSETPLTNVEILKKLQEEKEKAFLSFATGVWVTSYARNNLLRNVLKVDEYCLYCDTDSMKLKEGYDKKVINDYNSFVESKIKKVSQVLDIPIDRFAPKDVKGVSHMLGVFDLDGNYSEFITQGAKKYAYRDKKDNSLHITVAGVPKRGVVCLNDDLNNFRDSLLFTHEATNKNLLQYTEAQTPIELTDYQGNIALVTDKSGCCLIPTTYILSKSNEYATLLSDLSSKRAVYKE